MKTNTALLIFARTASEESKHKSFRASEAFFQYQNKQILRLADSSGKDFYWIDEHAQVGKNFEQRYLNAIQSIFNKGYKQVISVGNDSPELNLNHLLKAIESLQHNDMCFGPSKDGGFYLWGLKREHFEKKRYLDFAWKTKDLLSEILAELKQQNVTVSCIQTLTDLDRREDALLLLNKTQITSQLKSILFQILHQDIELYLYYPPKLKPRFTDVYFNKGSPLAA